MENWLREYIEGLSSAEYHIQLVLLFAALAYILYKTFQNFHRYRFIGDTPTARIASAPQGYIEIKGLGEMMPGAEIKSPFSSRRCLWYQCKVEKRQRVHKHSIWVEESNEISDHLFHIQDETGLCVIIPDGATVIPSEQTIWYGSNYHDKYQGKLKSWWFSSFMGFGRFRFTERLITVADPMYAIGNFRTVQKNIDLQTLDTRSKELINSWKQDPVRYLKQFDIDNNNKIQRAEWRLIRQHAERIIREQFGQTQYHTLSQPQESNHPFLISAIPEEELLKKKRMSLVLYLVLFFLLLYVLLTAIKIN